MSNEDFKAFFRLLASGVCVVTFQRGAHLHGFTATSVTSVSMNPPMALFCVARNNESHRHLRPGTLVGISILTRSQEALSNHFASKAGRGGYDDVETVHMARGVPLVSGALGHLEGTVADAIPVGDHSVVLCGLEKARAEPGSPPLLYYRQRYHDLMLSLPAGEGV